MSGKLGLSSPWTRQYLPVEVRPEVEAQIPDGFLLGVACGTRPGKPWHFRMMWEEDRSEPVWKMDVYMLDLRKAALFALKHHAEKVA